MPYLSQELTKKIRSEIKAEFPASEGWKFSIRNEGHSSINVTILKAPINMLKEENERGHVFVNNFYIDSHYGDHPEICNVLTRLEQIMSQDVYEVVYDGDYGSIPSYYLHLQIGKWDKPFEVSK